MLYLWARKFMCAQKKTCTLFNWLLSLCFYFFYFIFYICLLLFKYYHVVVEVIFFFSQLISDVFFFSVPQRVMHAFRVNLFYFVLFCTAIFSQLACYCYCYTLYLMFEQNNDKIQFAREIDIKRKTYYTNGLVKQVN